MLKLFNNVPLFRKLMFVFGFVFALTVLMSFVNYRNYYDDKQQMTLNVLSQSNVQAGNKIDEYLTDISGLLKLPYVLNRNDSSFMELLAEYNRTNTLDYQLKVAFNDIYSNVYELKRSVESEFIFNINGANDSAFYDDSNIEAGYNPSGEAWFVQAIQSGGKPVVIGARVLSTLGNGQPVYTFSVARAIVDYLQPATLGVMRINTNVNELDKYLRPTILTPSQRIQLIDADGMTVYDNQKQNMMKPAPDDMKAVIHSGRDISRSNGWIVSRHHLPFSGWTLVSMVPEKELYKDLNRTTRFVLIVTGAVLLATTFLLLLLTVNIMAPIRRLMTHMKRMELGDFSQGTLEDRKDEFGVLSNNFSKMAKQIKKLIDEVYLEKLTQKELELQMLQYQINPHFLYNTLESIQMMAIINKDRETAEMVQALGKILRYSISSKGDYVKLGEEVELLGDYIKLQQQRFEDLYRIQLDIPDELADAVVPRLMLQPLVENAIYHGLRNKEEGGRVDIRGRREGHDIILEVQDNGTGMEEEELRRLRQYIEDDSEESHSIGLKNVNKRIRLYYGDEFGIRIDSVAGTATTMSIRLPYLLRD
ncbi:cache domain-containing sensor histidine kinase [Cohnella sp. 56]|uniref:cache domain-containing sensor histidine kinase n=1 Tax=Cohnella sp. 56 TaxID=3113722 RepID=UPI0030E9FCDD